MDTQYHMSQAQAFLTEARIILEDPDLHPRLRANLSASIGLGHAILALASATEDQPLRNSPRRPQNAA